MKTIGLIGGMSWESTVTYYRIINETVRDCLGGLHSASLLLESLNLAEMDKLQQEGNWQAFGEIMTRAALKLQNAGADFIVICANTAHKVVPQMEAGLQIPVLHIAQVAAEVLRERGIKRVALLGTAYTLHEDFITGRLAEAGIKVLLPEEPDIDILQRIIYEELCQGQVREKSKAECLRMMAYLKEAGAQGVLLGCTELDLLLKPADVALPLLDSTAMHAERAATLALGML